MNHTERDESILIAFSLIFLILKLMAQLSEKSDLFILCLVHLHGTSGDLILFFISFILD